MEDNSQIPVSRQTQPLMSETSKQKPENKIIKFFLRFLILIFSIIFIIISSFYFLFPTSYLLTPIFDSGEINIFVLIRITYMFLSSLFSPLLLLLIFINLLRLAEIKNTSVLKCGNELKSILPYVVGSYLIPDVFRFVWTMLMVVWIQLPPSIISILPNIAAVYLVFAQTLYFILAIIIIIYNLVYLPRKAFKNNQLQKIN